jgi:hypothetical protein
MTKLLSLLLLLTMMFGTIDAKHKSTLLSKTVKDDAKEGSLKPKAMGWRKKRPEDSFERFTVDESSSFSASVKGGHDDDGENNNDLFKGGALDYDGDGEGSVELLDRPATSLTRHGVNLKRGILIVVLLLCLACSVAVSVFGIVKWSTVFSTVESMNADSIDIFGVRVNALVTVMLSALAATLLTVILVIQFKSRH